ncbi:MAG TPA: transglutaminase domain-containing protein [Terriglobales bacterium]|nr:transglutaminase domain-containing protein [Terriglobales bacterium]
MNDPANVAPASANLRATAILDIDHKEVRKLAETLEPNPPDRTFLQKAHLHLVQTLRPVYSVNEWQPASRTLQKGRGSCSQRMACLEAIARAGGIATRVRAFFVKGSFWYPRFRFSRWFIPKSILLVWPQFFLEGLWKDFDELYAPMAQLAASAAPEFTNDGESLFEAVQNTPVDFLGKTCGLECAKPEHNLSKFVLADEGFFDTRDEVFERFGSFQDTPRGWVFEAVFGDKKVGTMPVLHRG